MPGRGGCEVGGGGWLPPPHGLPFTVQLVGFPEPVTMKPNDTEAPAATEPFQLRFTAVWWLPDVVTVASQ